MSREERALWRRAVRDVSPLRQTSPEAVDSTVPAPAPSKPASRPPVSDAHHPPSAATAKPGHFVFDGGDPRLDRAASSRRMAIEGTLDLHGMTQIEARRALLQFMAAAVHEGARLILVITGKGKSPASTARGGVLRSRFLDWIEEHPLKSEIARVAAASQKDGGAGAFYVFLKRKSVGARRRY